MAEIKNGKLQLPNVTLAAMTSVNRQATLKALEYSMRGIDFGEVVFISDKSRSTCRMGLPMSISIP